MFGWRNDGKNVSKQLDPLVLFTPLIMPTRCESMNMITYPVEYEPMAAYIRKQKSAGKNISFMTIIMAAYARTCAYHPYLNYFVMGKKVYSHKELSTSLVVLKDTGDGSLREGEAKIVLDSSDTIYQVIEKMDKEIAIARRPDEGGDGTSKFASTLLRIPLLPSLVVMLARLMDRIGILPKWINHISPFHCSMFITNMMSIGLPSIYHHLYNFGTCSVFISLGKPERQFVTSGGNPVRKLMLPLGIVTDERICGGANYALAVHRFLKYLKDPALLELSLEEEKAKASDAPEPVE